MRPADHIENHIVRTSKFVEADNLALEYNGRNLIVLNMEVFCFNSEFKLVIHPFDNLVFILLIVTLLLSIDAYSFFFKNRG